MKIGNWKLKISKLLNPQPPIGGLEISESELRFALIKDSEVVSAALRLPPGIIEGGKIKNPEGFKSVLAELHSQIVPGKKKKIYVVVNIPESSVYLQVFNLPLIAVNNLEEAVKLNLQMISPMDYQTVYSDWQKVGEVETDGGQLEILGAFAPKQIVDEFTNCLTAANFVVTAIEIPGLALSRLLGEQDVKSRLQSVALVRLSSNGLSFSIIRNGNLYFSRFVAWQTGQISLAALQDIIISEAQKVLNFYAGHWPSPPLSAFLIAVPTPAMEEKISKIITETFSLEVYPLRNFIGGQTQKLNISSLGSESLVVLGSALRGLIPRSEDTVISAASVGTEEDFRQNQIMNFISAWRNIILTVVAFILVVFLGTEAFLMQTGKSLENSLSSVSVLADNTEFNQLHDKAKAFNQTIDFVLQAKAQGNDWTPFLQKIRDLAGTEIVLRRIFVQSLGIPVQINAQAASGDEIINFKNALSADPQFQDVNLPLLPSDRGVIDFNISFKIKSL